MQQLAKLFTLIPEVYCPHWSLLRNGNLSGTGKQAARCAVRVFILPSTPAYCRPVRLAITCSNGCRSAAATILWNTVRFCVSLVVPLFEPNECTVLPPWCCQERLSHCITFPGELPNCPQFVIYALVSLLLGTSPGKARRSFTTLDTPTFYTRFSSVRRFAA